MKTRIVVSVLGMTLIAASQVSASIISASSEYRRAEQSARVAEVDAVSVQNDINAELRGVGDEGAVGTLSGVRAPRTTTGGFMITSGGRSAAAYVGSGHDPMDGVLGSNGGNASPGLGGGSVADLSPGRGGRHGRDRDDKKSFKDKGKKGDKGRGRHGGGDRNGVQVAPEPSTWLLLATGLGLMGAYGVMRRRQAVRG
jgi:hypothetical protein